MEKNLFIFPFSRLTFFICLNCIALVHLIVPAITPQLVSQGDIYNHKNRHLKEISEFDFLRVGVCIWSVGNPANGTQTDEKIMA